MFIYQRTSQHKRLKEGGTALCDPIVSGGLEGCVRISHLTDISTRLHATQPVFVPKPYRDELRGGLNRLELPTKVSSGRRRKSASVLRAGAWWWGGWQHINRDDRTSLVEKPRCVACYDAATELRCHSVVEVSCTIRSSVVPGQDTHP